MIADLQSRLARLNQGHLLQFYSELDKASGHQLLEQIQAIDLDLISRLFQHSGSSDTWAELARRAQPPAAIRLNDSQAVWTRPEAVQAGEQALKHGHVGMILVAGGQGSRLGFEHPKGMYPLGPVTQRTLFQIHIDKLRAIEKHFGAPVPLYIMTSPATDLETRSFLKEQQWFGYSADQIRIFCQGTMPAVDVATGKILLSAKDQLFASPDGHGGMLAALAGSGCLEEIASRGLQQIFYCQVDNPLCQICDAATIGYHILADSELTAQAVPKTDPLQKVGNIVSIDGKVQIIEYSDLPEDVAKRTSADGSLLFWAGNIAVHVFNVSFLERMADHADALPFHLAYKKVPFIDAQGNRVQPDQPNAIKFEKFIFDLLPMAEHSIVVEVDPQKAFSPVKNAASESFSTPLTAQRAMVAQATTILNEAGVLVEPDVPVELDPLLALDRKRLEQIAANLGSIQKPTYIQAD